MDFDENNPTETVAAIMTVILGRRHPEITDPDQLDMAEMETLKTNLFEVFTALLALGYRVYRLPQNVTAN